MKLQKGVTLTSLTIYVVLVLIILAILATVSGTFQSNIKEISGEGINNYEIDKFTIYLLKEVKKQGNEVENISENEILFKLGNKFTYKENCIYLNDNIKLSEHIEKCVFSKYEENGKTIINLKIKALNCDEKDIEYVLNSKIDSITNENESDYIY